MCVCVCVCVCVSVCVCAYVCLWPRPQGRKQSFFLRLPGHGFKNICVHMDPLKIPKMLALDIHQKRRRRHGACAESFRSVYKQTVEEKPNITRQQWRVQGDRGRGAEYFALVTLIGSISTAVRAQACCPPPLLLLL